MLLSISRCYIMCCDKTRAFFTNLYHHVSSKAEPLQPSHDVAKEHWLKLFNRVETLYLAIKCPTTTYTVHAHTGVNNVEAQ